MIINYAGLIIPLMTLISITLLLLQVRLLTQSLKLSI